MSRLITLWATFLITTLLYSQSIVTKKFTTDNGLMANDVRTLFLDSNGILWIGSRAGLTTMQHGKITPNQESIVNRFTNIATIKEDGFQRIWIGSYGQGILIRGKEGTTVLTKQNGLISDRVRTLLSYKDFIYAGTDDGISVINIKTFDIKSIKPNYLKDELFAISSFYIEKDEIYATSLNHGIFKITGNSVSLVKDTKRVISIFNDTKQLLIGLAAELLIENKEKATTTHFPITGVRDYAQTREQVYFVSADLLGGSGAIYSWNGNEIEEVTKKFGITETELYTIVYDGQNNFLYIGTKQDGIYQIDLSSPITYLPEFGLTEVIHSVGDKLYVFSENGLDIVSQKKIVKNVSKQSFKKFQNTHNEIFKNVVKRENHFYEIDHTLSADKLSFYKAVTHQNSIWISTNFGLFKMSMSGEFEHYIGINTMQFDFYKNKLIETDPYGGVRVYNNPLQFKYAFFDRDDNVNVPRDIVGMFTINKKLYFLGILDGLYVYANGKLTSFFANNQFTENRIRTGAEGEGNTLFLANDFNEVYHLDLSTEIPQIVNKIGKNSIKGYGITFVRYINNQLFIGTNQGINILDGSKKFFFNKEQGLENTNITSVATIDDELYMATDAGIYVLNTRYFYSKKTDYKMLLSSIAVNGSKVKNYQNDLFPLTSIELPYNENSVSIDFILLGAKYPQKVYYKYRVKTSEEWKDIENENIFLSYLNYGSYPIEIKIYDYDSGYEQILPLLHVKIKPPFYFTWWFVFLMLLLVFSVTYGVYRSRLKKITEKQEIKNKQYDYERKMMGLKLQSVRSQLNTHFVFNVLSSFQYFIISQKVNEALYYLDRFASLIRSTLNLSTVDRINLTDELNYIRSYFELENMRLDGRAQLEINVENDVLQEKITIPPLLLQPFVENCLIHAFPADIKKPTIWINIYFEQNDLIIEVEDNGVGNRNDSNEKHESKGLKIVKERMKMIQDYLEEHISINITEKGTKVRLTLKNIIESTDK